MPFTNVTTFADGGMAGESIYFDLAPLCEQAGIPLDAFRVAARQRAAATAAVDDDPVKLLRRSAARIPPTTDPREGAPACWRRRAVLRRRSAWHPRGSCTEGARQGVLERRG